MAAKSSARGSPLQRTGASILTERFGIRPAICSIALLLHPYDPTTEAYRGLGRNAFAICAA